jgi:hypothetical protein
MREQTVYVSDSVPRPESGLGKIPRPGVEPRVIGLAIDFKHHLPPKVRVSALLELAPVAACACKLNGGGTGALAVPALELVSGGENRSARFTALPEPLPHQVLRLARERLAGAPGKAKRSPRAKPE